MATLTLSAPRRKNVLGVILALLALAAAVVLLSSDPHLLVALSSDREGQALLPVGTLGPGQAASGRLVLANEGLLPLTYTLQVSGGADQSQTPVVMRVRRTDQNFFLYQGPPPRSPVTLGRMLPGEHVQLEVVAVAPRSQASFSLPADYTFTWTARSPGFSAWWWLITIALALAAASFLMPRVYVFGVWLTTRRHQVPDRYWRVPLILAALLLAALVPLTGVSLSSVNASTRNPGNVFAIGALVLSDRSPRGSTCISVTGNQAVPPQNHCDAIFRFSQTRPGDTGIAKLTIRNVGTIPTSKLQLWSDGCSTIDAPGEQFHGTADVCGLVQLAVHDDNHDLCYFPVRASGPCDMQPGGTLKAFAATFSPQSRLDLSSDGLGAGTTYTFSLQLDPGVLNNAQGRSPIVNFFWEVNS
jgi:hypothetical protein